MSRLTPTASSSFQLPFRTIPAVGSASQALGTNSRAGLNLPLNQQLPALSSGGHSSTAYPSIQTPLASTLEQTVSIENEISPKDTCTVGSIKEAHAKAQIREIQSRLSTLLVDPRNGGQREESEIAKKPEQQTNGSSNQGLKRKQGFPSDETSGLLNEESDDDVESPLPFSTQCNNLSFQKNDRVQTGHDMQDCKPAHHQLMMEAVLKGAHPVLEHFYKLRSTTGNGPGFMGLKTEFKIYYNNLTKHLSENPDTGASLVLARYMTEQASIHRHLQALASSAGVKLPDVAKVRSRSVSTGLSHTSNTSHKLCKPISKASGRQDFLRTNLARTMGRSTDIDWALLGTHTEGVQRLLPQRSDYASVRA